MQLHTMLEKSFAEAVAVVRGVEPDQFSAPTPCQDWDVRALTNHLLQVVCALSLAGRRRAVPDELWGRDLMSDGWADRFDEEGRTAVAAWAEAEARGGTVTVGDAEMPAPMVVTMLASDLVIHAWDLARATGQSYRCDDEVAELTRRFVTDMGEQGRQMGIYGAPLAVANDVPAFEQALALSGRDPHWARPTIFYADGVGSSSQGKRQAVTVAEWVHRPGRSI